MAQSRPHIRTLPINQGASSGATTIIPAVAGRSVVIWGYAFTMSADGTAQFREAGGGAVQSGPMDYAAKGGIVVPTGEDPVMQFAVGAAVELNTTGGAANGHVTYSYE